MHTQEAPCTDGRAYVVCEDGARLPGSPGILCGKAGGGWLIYRGGISDGRWRNVWR